MKLDLGDHASAYQGDDWFNGLIWRLSEVGHSGLPSGVRQETHQKLQRADEPEWVHLGFMLGFRDGITWHIVRGRDET